MFWVMILLMALLAIYLWTEHSQPTNNPQNQQDSLTSTQAGSTKKSTRAHAIADNNNAIDTSARHRHSDNSLRANGNPSASYRRAAHTASTTNTQLHYAPPTTGNTPPSQQNTASAHEKTTQARPTKPIGTFGRTAAQTPTITRREPATSRASATNTAHSSHKAVNNQTELNQNVAVPEVVRVKNNSTGKPHIDLTPAIQARVAQARSSQASTAQVRTAQALPLQAKAAQKQTTQARTTAQAQLSRNQTTQQPSPARAVSVQATQARATQNPISATPQSRRAAQVHNTSVQPSQQATQPQQPQVAETRASAPTARSTAASRTATATRRAEASHTSARQAVQAKPQTMPGDGTQAIKRPATQRTVDARNSNNAPATKQANTRTQNYEYDGLEDVGDLTADIIELLKSMNVDQEESQPTPARAKTRPLKKEKLTLKRNSSGHKAASNRQNKSENA